MVHNMHRENKRVAAKISSPLALISINNRIVGAELIKSRILLGYNTSPGS
jgi:hypothetical protein